MEEVDENKQVGVEYEFFFVDENDWERNGFVCVYESIMETFKWAKQTYKRNISNFLTVCN